MGWIGSQTEEISTEVPRAYHFKVKNRFNGNPVCKRRIGRPNHYIC